jgi:hypothetical protein
MSEFGRTRSLWSPALPLRGRAEGRARLSKEQHAERRVHHDMDVVDKEKDSCDKCHRRDFSVDPRYKLMLTVVSNKEIRTCKLAKVKPR